MIEGFFLPELLTFASENLICCVSACAFQSMGYLCERNSWFNKNVDVIWHNDKGVKTIKVQLFFTAADRVCDAVRDTWFLKPKGTMQSFVKFGLGDAKTFSGSTLG